MSAVQTIGGGVAPGRRGTTVSQTEVARVPYWVPWDHEGKGGWRLVPADTTHDAAMVTLTGDTDATGKPRKQTEPYYQAKGFVPERYAQEHVPALVKLAQDANKRRAAEMLPPDAWAVGVLNRYPELVKANASADAA